MLCSPSTVVHIGTCVSDGIATKWRRAVVISLRPRLRFAMSWLMSPSLRIRSDELRTVRQAMRDVGTLLSELEDGDVKKLVNTQRDWVRAVVVSFER